MHVLPGEQYYQIPVYDQSSQSIYMEVFLINKEAVISNAISAVS